MLNEEQKIKLKQAGYNDLQIGVFEGTQKQAAQPKKQSYGQQVIQNFKTGFNKAVEGVDQVQELGDLNKKQNPLKAPLKGFEAIGKIGSGVSQALFSPVTPALQQVTKPVTTAVNYTADKISNSPAVQRYANSQQGQDTSRLFENISNYNEIAGSVVGPKTAPKVTSKVTGAVTNAVDNVATKASGAIDNVTTKVGTVAKTRPGGFMGNVADDILPASDRLVNENITKALDLTQGDASTFYQSMGKDVGRFVADNNLIRNNKELTTQAINDFFDKNYKAVRSEIDKVTTPYKPSQVPRYTEALKSIKMVVNDVPGLQQASVEIDNLLGKKTGITLADVQRVKELVDDYHAIYKRTGDVKDGVKAQGLDNIRAELKEFIEKEVNNNSGADIREFNRNVSGSKQLMDMIEVRSPRGLTRANLGVGDWATMGAGAAISFPVLGPLAPLGGIAALFVKKAIQSPSVMLKISKFLDGLSDARKAQIKSDLESGVLPDDFKQFVKPPRDGKGYGPGAMLRGELEHSSGGLSKKLNVEDMGVMETFIDAMRVGGKKGTKQLQTDVKRIADHYGIKGWKTGTELANKFDDVLAKQNYRGTNRTGFTKFKVEQPKSLAEFASEMKVNNAKDIYQKLQRTGSAVVAEKDGVRITLKDEGDFVTLGMDTGKLTSTDVKLPSKTFATKEEALVGLKPLYEAKLKGSRRLTPNIPKSI